MATQRRKYLFKAFVNPDPLGLRQDHKSYVMGFIAARHKWNRADESPYCVANEIICAELGRFIGLPIPPYAITRTVGDEFSDRDLVSSLDFNWDGRNLSPVEPDYCVKALPSLCTGIVAFDVLIANADRHDENVAVDRTDSPKDMRVFDHDGALFGNIAGEGINRLNAMEGRLGITGNAPTGGNRHIFIDTVVTNEHFNFWIKRLYEIPEGFIERLCNRAKEFGITQEESSRAERFLASRKREIQGLIVKYRSEFTGIKSWPSL
jgi:hypothetical protein